MIPRETERKAQSGSGSGSKTCDEKQERGTKLNIVSIVSICRPRWWIVEGSMEASRIEPAGTMAMAMMLLSSWKEAPSDIVKKNGRIEHNGKLSHVNRMVWGCPEWSRQTPSGTIGGNLLS